MNTLRSWLFDRLDLAGTVGSLVTAACCLGIAPLLAVLGAVGLGFVINDAVLLPLLVVFLAATLIGLWRGFGRHRNPAPLVLGLVAAGGILVFLFVSYRQTLAYLAMGTLFVSTVWNVLARRRCRREACEVR